jgi:short-subunit dehydrogenase
MSAIVITGAGSGLGRELALEYSSPTHTVLLVGRTESTLIETKMLIENKGHDADYFICDVRDSKFVLSTFENITNSYFVQTLINNTGIGFFGQLETIDDESIRQVIDTNVTGTILMTKYFLDHLKQQDHAKILNIISTAGLRGKSKEAVYCASKFAIRGFTESLQKELENTSITVTAVYMGGMDTPFWNETDHIKDKTRLRSPAVVAKQIKEEDDGRLEIIIG